MLPPEFKLIYADTNVVSNFCKQDGTVLDFIRHFPPGENYLLCFSTYTLFEISRSSILMPHFRKLFSVYPCAILASYFALGLKEYNMIAGETKLVDPVLLSPQGIRVNGKSNSPDSLDIVLQSPGIIESFGNIEQKTEELFDEYSTLLDKDEFKEFNGAVPSRNQFVRKFKEYELKRRFFGGQWKKPAKENLVRLKTLDVLAQGLYYKFYSDTRRKISKSDVIDILIMTTAPYCEAYISENNSIDIFRKINKMNDCGISVKLMTLSDLKK